MKELNKKIVSLSLAAALAGSVLPSMANAQGYDEEAQITNYYANNEETIKLFRLNGVYTVLNGKEPVYVFLNNDFSNLVLPKNDALIFMAESYKETYLMKKTVKNPYYEVGMSEEYKTVYAVSSTKDVPGWVNVKKSSVSPDVQVATTIELGEFLLKDVDLSAYNNNTLGFAKGDINGDGKANEWIYLGNNKENTIMTKASAVKYAATNRLYYQVKRLPDFRNPGKEVVSYALSDKSYVPGWTRISKDNIPNTAKVASNTEYAEAVYAITYNRSSLVEDTIYVEISNPGLPYSSMLKDQALEFAYNNYPDFCILAKAISEGEVIYAFCEGPEIDYWTTQEWTFIGNDYISKDSSIFLSMSDACNYINSLDRGYAKTLLP